MTTLACCRPPSCIPPWICTSCKTSKCGTNYWKGDNPCSLFFFPLFSTGLQLWFHFFSVTLFEHSQTSLPKMITPQHPQSMALSTGRVDNSISSLLLQTIFFTVQLWALFFSVTLFDHGQTSLPKHIKPEVWHYVNTGAWKAKTSLTLLLHTLLFHCAALGRPLLLHHPLWAWPGFPPPSRRRCRPSTAATSQKQSRGNSRRYGLRFLSKLGL